MKFACDKCQTRYSIADERVRGRVLKIKCKSCAHVITVREERSADVAVAVAAAGGARRSTVDNAIEDSFGRPGINDSHPDEEHTMISSGPVDLAALGLGGEPAPATGSKDDWYVSFDGEQEGPYALEKAQARVRAEHGSGREAHCWRPGFLVWLTVEEVPELVQRAAPKPAKAPPPTPALPKRPATQLKSVPDADSKPHPKVEPAAAKPPLPSMPVPRTSVPGVPPVPSVQAVAPRPATPFAAAPAPVPAAKVAAVAEAATTPEKVKMVEAALPAVADRVETGPVALPPAPGRTDDLLISEPSGLFNLSHVAAMHSTQKAAAVAARNAPVTPMPVAGPTPEPTPAAASAAAFPLPEAAPNQNPAPVVVVTGPAPRSLSPVVKWAAVLGVLLSLGLGGTLIYVLTHNNGNNQPVAVAPKVPIDPARAIDNTPIAIGDGVVPKPATPASATPAAQPKRPSQPRPNNPPAAAGSKLSESQKNLAALYSDGVASSAPKELQATDRGSKGSGGASQNAILGVVTQNRRSLNLCYDRVLKHDSSLKRARLLTRVKVGISGTVLSASIADAEYATSEIGTCIAGAVKRWHFPASDSEYETEFPIILQAE